MKIVDGKIINSCLECPRNYTQPQIDMQGGVRSLRFCGETHDDVTWEYGIAGTCKYADIEEVKND